MWKEIKLCLKNLYKSFEKKHFLTIMFKSVFVYLQYYIKWKKDFYLLLYCLFLL